MDTINLLPRKYPPDWDSVVEELDTLLVALMTVRANGGPTGLSPRRFRTALGKAITYVSKAGGEARDCAEEASLAERLLAEQRANGIPEIVGALPKHLRPI